MDPAMLLQTSVDLVPADHGHTWEWVSAWDGEALALALGYAIGKCAEAWAAVEKQKVRYGGHDDEDISRE